VEIPSFLKTVYRESPRLRDDRYIERDNRTYVIEPGERTIIEEIDQPNGRAALGPSFSPIL
jgi:hypothetical protein